MSRTVKEWIGRTENSMPPPRVRLRVFLAYGGICYISGRLIRPGEKWQLDHVVALINEGENRESNLAPVLTVPHQDKTRDDVAEKSKVYVKRCKHRGIKTRRRTMGYRRFDGSPVKPRFVT